MAHLSISLFGSFQVSLAGRPVTDFGTDKTRALLAYLVVEADHPQRRDALAGLLWADHPQARARQSLRQALSQLRQAIADQDQTVPFLLISRETIQFNPAGDHRLDVAEFSALAEENRTHRHRRPASCAPCMRRMAGMAELYGGSFLAGFFLDDSYAFEEWATLQREHSQRQMMDALAHLVEYHERRGDVRQALQVAGRQAQIEPWCEEAHRQLMRLLALDGQRSAALAQYNACRQSLAEELDVEPTAETTALYEQIRDQGGQDVERPPPGIASRRHDLPPSPTPFVGREEDVAELLELLADPECRLVTLTGPGGIGKTRLALQIADDEIGIFAHGVAFVPLAALPAVDLLVPALAEALGFCLHSQGDPEQQISDFLREKEMLLVLDNMEHLIEGSDLASRLLRHAPEITLLVTSRERLNLHEEWVYSLDGLAQPTDPATAGLEAFDAVALFVQTARRGQRSFSLTEQEGPPVARICQLVEGLPLALELAASWVPSRTCQEVARQIERNLDALATPLRNVPERHRSLRAVFEHSWSLLTGQERAALRRLSVFQDGFEGAAAEQVTGASPGVLAALLAKSLLRRDASGRYDMHLLVQQYASEKLQEAGQEQQDVEMRHGEYYAQFLQERAVWFRDRRQADALAAITAEIENVRLAWRLAVAKARVKVVARSLDSLGTFYAIRSWHQEGGKAFDEAVDSLTRSLALPAVDVGGPFPSTRKREIVLGACLAWQGYFVYQLGHFDTAQNLLTQSLDLLDAQHSPQETAFSLLTLAQVLCFGQNEYREAERIFQESLARYQALDDAYGRAQSLDGLGDVAARQGRHDDAQQHYEQGLALRREIGDMWGGAASLGSLGGLAGRQGRYNEARRWFEESLSLGRELQNPRGVAASLHNLSTVAYLQQEYAEAKHLRLETLAICREIGYRWGIASALKSLGDVAGRLGEYGEARRFLLQSLTLLEETGDRRSLAYALNSLGTVEQALGQQQEAKNYFRQAMQAAMEVEEPALALDVLTGIAQLCGAAGEVERALELVAFILQHPASEQQTRVQVEPLRAGFAARLSAEAAATAEARGRLLELDGIAAGILKGSSYRSRTT